MYDSLYSIESGNDSSDAIIVDHATHYVDLAASISKGNLVYKFGYSAREEYGMGDLSPESWDAMVARAANKGADGDRIFRDFRLYDKLLTLRFGMKLCFLDITLLKRVAHLLQI